MKSVIHKTIASTLSAVEQIGFVVGAPSAEEREERVQTLRREFAPIALHRPLGSQLDLFLAHLPAQRWRVRDYEDVLVCEQFGAMVPTAE